MCISIVLFFFFCENKLWQWQWIWDCFSGHFFFCFISLLFVSIVSLTQSKMLTEQMSDHVQAEKKRVNEIKSKIEREWEFDLNRKLRNLWRIFHKTTHPLLVIMPMSQPKLLLLSGEKIYFFFVSVSVRILPSNQRLNNHFFSCGFFFLSIPLCHSLSIFIIRMIYLEPNRCVHQRFATELEIYKKKRNIHITTECEKKLYGWE